MSETTLTDLADLGAAADVPATPAAPAAPLREREVDAQGRAYATGRRKDAVARVWIKPGSGKVVVNGRDQEVYFARPTLRLVLNQPFQVAEREGLAIRLELGDMRDLSRFGGETFDLVFHPVSNCFVDDVLPVWRECFRVLKRGGALLAGFVNPLLYIFDIKE